MKMADILKRAGALFCGMVGLLLCACTEEPEAGGVTDGSLTVRILPVELHLQEEYKACDALAVQWSWSEESPYRDNPQVSYTLELAEAGTDFYASYFAPLGTGSQKIFTVKELNELLIVNGVVENGGMARLEARLIATLDSYHGVRSESVTFTVSTYYIDESEIPPYDRIWFVGSFTEWKLVEMTRDPDNPFRFHIDIQLEDDGTNEFKFAVDQSADGKWWDNYKAPYADAPITETRVVQVHNDIVNDFKWKLTPEQCGKYYHIVLDITPDEERMYCTVNGETPPDVPDEPDEPEVPQDPFSVRIEARDCEFGCTDDESSVILEDDFIKGINFWRNGYIDIVVEDVPAEGEYLFMVGCMCWDMADYSFRVMVNDDWQEVQRVTPPLANATFEYMCTVPLAAGDNLITISGGTGEFHDGFAPHFKYFIVSNGVGNFPGDGAQGNDQGIYSGK